MSSSRPSARDDLVSQLFPLLPFKASFTVDDQHSDDGRIKDFCVGLSLFLWNYRSDTEVLKRTFSTLEQEAQAEPKHMAQYVALISSKEQRGQLCYFVSPYIRDQSQGSEQEQRDIEECRRLVMGIAALYISALHPCVQTCIFSYLYMKRDDHVVGSLESTSNGTFPCQTSSRITYTGSHESSSQPPPTNDCN